MLFNSLNFVVFFPLIILIYRFLPSGFRRAFLMIASLFFYGCFDIRSIPVLLGIILITYSAANAMDRMETGRKSVMLAAVVLCLATLGAFKYLSFIVNNLNAVLSRIHISFEVPSFSLIIPAGISFYTFKAVGYVADVYRGRQKAEKSFINYALFISFFPQIVAGPIDRADNLLKQIDDPEDLCEEDFRTGILLMLWGYFEKLVIADRISCIVDTVYNDHTSYPGAVIAFATVCYGIQIYADFAGYSSISIGASRMLGFKIKDNFRQPYLAVDIKDFWSRWHISMSTWFRDYVYIPLGGNRKGRTRKYVNNMITFLLSGLWHGSSWNFVAWGGLHGMYHLVSGVTSELRSRISFKLKLDENTFGRRLFKTLATFIMTDYAWMFFRAGSLSTAADMTGRIITDFRLYTLSGDWMEALSLPLPEAAVSSIFPAVTVLFVVDIMHERGFGFIKWLDRQGLIFRWLCYIGASLFIILAAVQNLGLSSSEFIYFRF